MAIKPRKPTTDGPAKPRAERSESRQTKGLAPNRNESRQTKQSINRNESRQTKQSLNRNESRQTKGGGNWSG